MKLLLFRSSASRSELPVIIKRKKSIDRILEQPFCSCLLSNLLGPNKNLVLEYVVIKSTIRHTSIYLSLGLGTLSPPTVNLSIACSTSDYPNPRILRSRLNSYTQEMNLINFLRFTTQNYKINHPSIINLTHVVVVVPLTRRKTTSLRIEVTSSSPCSSSQYVDPIEPVLSFR